MSGARDLLEYPAMLVNLGRDLPPFLRAPLTPVAARRRVIWELERREQRFLDLMDRAVYAHPRSPYRRLLAHAGCERGDLRALVEQEGLDGALRQLAAQGVYVTFDELKGRRPIERGSMRFVASDRDFDNPLFERHHYVVFTGGTGGRPVPVRRTLATVADAARMTALLFEAHEIRQPRNVFWGGGSPSAALVQMKLRYPIARWYYPIKPLPRLVWAGLAAIAALARLAGQRMPLPAYCDIADPEPIARWLVQQARPDRPIVLNTVVSSGVRIAGVAATNGQTLPGLILHGRSEPISPARRRQIEEVGMRMLADYSSNELPCIAGGCPTATESDDVHVWLQLYAVITRARPLFEQGPMVDGLLFTSLSPAAPKIALNAETGEQAKLWEGDCGCLLGSLGLRTHLSGIQSFEKLSTEGTTFALSNVVQILEETLPARFGGSGVDYQLVEEEAERGMTRLELRVDPRLGPLDEVGVRAALLEGLGRGGMVDAYQARLIERAESIVVRRLPPLATGAGKILPLRLQNRAPTSLS